MTHPAAEKWDKLARVPCSISSDSRCCSPCRHFFILGFLGGSCELWLRRIWPIKVVFAPRRNAKQTFWKWKDFLLIPFHAHLLSSEVTMGPEEAAWGRQMDCGRRAGGYSSNSDLVRLPRSQHVRMGSDGGGPGRYTSPYPAFALFLTVSPSVRPKRATSVGSNMNSSPAFFMSFMKTRSAFHAFLRPTPVFFPSLFCSSSHCRLSWLSVGVFSARLNSR